MAIDETIHCSDTLVFYLSINGLSVEDEHKGGGAEGALWTW